MKRAPHVEEPASSPHETMPPMRQRVVRLPTSAPTAGELEMIDWLLKQAFERWRRTA